MYIGNNTLIMYIDHPANVNIHIIIARNSPRREYNFIGKVRVFCIIKINETF